MPQKKNKLKKTRKIHTQDPYLLRVADLTPVYTINGYD
jgi:hypothetical protein